MSVTARSQSLVQASHTKGSNYAGDAIMSQMDRLQGEQVNLARKIEKEKKRKEALFGDIHAARIKLRTFQDATKGGSIVKDEDIVSRKLIAKLEHSLQQARIKLSATHKDNASYKHKIDETRQDKLMHLNILRNLEREYHESKIKIAAQQKEINEVNEEKHRLDVKISNIKDEMFRDMNLFSNELVMAKRNISHTQTHILDSIRERLQSTFNNLDLLDDNDAAGGKPTTTHSTAKTRNESEERQAALQELLEQVGVETLERLIVTLQQSEEAIFARYNDVQSATAETERMELENKHLDEEVAKQAAELQGLESSNEKKQRDLEGSITSIQSLTIKCEADLSLHESALGAMQANLVKLFRNIAIDEAVDQQILETGINDRNITDYLGIVEQRIDDLIQMRRAAEHQVLEREDFVKSISRKKEGSLVRPTLPDSRVDVQEEEFGEEDGQGKVQPVSVSMLKEFMNKKVQRGLKKKDLAEALAKASKGGKGGGGGGGGGLGGDLDEGDLQGGEMLEGSLMSPNAKPRQAKSHHHHIAERKRRGTRYSSETSTSNSTTNESAASPSSHAKTTARRPSVQSGAAGGGGSPSSLRRSSNAGLSATSGEPFSPIAPPMHERRSSSSVPVSKLSSSR